LLNWFFGARNSTWMFIRLFTFLFSGSILLFFSSFYLTNLKNPFLINI
jgi:hypothetical protein